MRGVSAGELTGTRKGGAMAVGEANAAWGSHEKNLKINSWSVEKIKKHTKQETYAHLCCKGVAAVKMAPEKSAENSGRWLQRWLQRW